MDLQKYQELSAFTCCHEDKVEINPVLLMNTLSMFIHSARILELIKKFIFYGKPIEKNDIIHALRNIAEAHRRLQFTSLETVDQSLMVQTIHIDPDLFHAVIGIASESGELLEHLKFDGTAIDKTGLAEELGDQHWYQALLIRNQNLNWASVLDANIEKLQKRYPNKFRPEDAINRDLPAERAVVENHLVVENPTKKVIKKKPTKKVIKKNPAVKKKQKFEDPLIGFFDAVDPDES